MWDFSQERTSPAAVLYPAATASLLSLLLVFSGIGCAGGTGGSSAAQTAPTVSTASTPSIQPAGSTFTAAQSVSITDSTSGATICHTTDGSTPSTSSPVYSAPFSLASATNVQAIATATGYHNSSSTSASFKFRAPAATYPINVTATATGSTKLLQLNSIALTLIVQ